MSGHSIPTQSGAETLLANILERLQKKGADFAIIHTPNGSTLDTTSDIDIAFRKDPREILEPILTTIQALGLALTVQRLHYEVPYGFYYILSPADSPLDFLHLDCLYDPYGLSRYHLSTRFLLGNIDRSTWIPKVCAQRQALYLLVKLSIKGNAAIEQIIWIRDMLEQPDEHTMVELRACLGDSTVGNLHHILSPDSSEAIPHLLKTIRHKIQIRYYCLHPIRSITGKVWTIFRISKRIAKPSGIFMVLVGPDGSGKSTINTLLHQQMARAFRQTHHFHWRPGLLPKLGGRKSDSVNDSHTPDLPAITSKYGVFVSLLRFSYYTADFLIGYWLWLYPLKARTTLIIGERYFLDILVHPARYGFELPKWLLRTVSTIIPKPDLTVLLGNDPATIYRRKAELPVEEIQSQLDKYSSEIEGWGQAVIVPTEGSPYETAKSISNRIIQVCARKC